MPLVTEDLVVEKRPVTTGGVRVEKYVDERIEKIDMPLAREEVDIERILIGEVVERRPETRKEGDVLIIPIVEEELVITKRLVLKEELRLTRRRTVRRSADEVTLRKERAEVTRVDAEGRSVPVQAEVTQRRSLRRKSILKD